LSQPAELGRAIPSVVRLQTLDECERLFGNLRKGLLKKVVTQRQGTGDRRIAGGWDFGQKRELAVFKPPWGQGDIAGIALDEIERQVIECRSELINNLPNQDGNIGGRLGGKAKFLCAVRLFGNQVRLTANVLIDGTLDSLDVYRSPLDFKPCGFDARCHNTPTKSAATEHSEAQPFTIWFPLVLVEYTPCGRSEPANQSEPIYSVEELLAHPFVRKYGTGCISHILSKSPDSKPECPADMVIPAGRVYPEHATEAEPHIPCNP
jgi:hypothetical protein